jgi:ABC-type bacteriocin/lantibiotic exporter with double-glycine peptidase domain
MKYLKKIQKFVRLNAHFYSYLGRRKVLFFALLAFLSSVFNSVNFIALIPLASRVLDREEGGATSLGGLGNIMGISSFINESSVLWVGFFVILTFVLKVVTNVAFSHFAGKRSEQYMFFLRRSVVGASLENYYQKGADTNSWVIHLNSIIPRVGSYNWVSLSVLSKALSAIILFCSLVLISFKFAAVSLLFVLFWGSILVFAFRHTRVSAQSYTQFLNNIQKFILDEINAKEIIKIFALSTGRAELFKVYEVETVKANVYMSDIRAFVSNLQEFMIIFFGVVVLCLAQGLNLKVGYIMAYGYAFAKFVGALNDAGGFFNTALEMMPSAEEVLGYVTPWRSSPAPKEAGGTPDRIQELEYRNVDFGWNEKKLFRIDRFRLRSGDKVLISGRNGEGKSTLLRVLMGILRASGTFRVNEGEVMELEKIPLIYPRVSYIPQKAVLFEGNLLENLLLNSGKNAEDVKRLTAELEIDLNDYFPNWIQFEIKESGSNLSGGEMQLVGIIRALMRDFDVLFIDEFTNHLSPKLVKSVDSYLGRMERQIIVCVSHSELSFYTRECVLKDGVLR